MYFQAIVARADLSEDAAIGKTSGAQRDERGKQDLEALDEALLGRRQIHLNGRLDSRRPLTPCLLGGIGRMHKAEQWLLALGGDRGSQGQGEQEGAERIRAALSGDAATVPPQPESSRERRERIITTLEGWLATLGRDSI